MQVKVRQSRLHGTIRANASKSYAQRAYAIAALATSASRISNTSWSDDAVSALSIAKNLGSKVDIDGDVVHIFPKMTTQEADWQVGEAGLSLRMFAPISALFDHEITISGHGSLLSRPTGFISNTLQMMGAQVTGEALPLKIKGPLQAGSYRIDGNFSSQLLTGLLIALPTLDRPSQLLVDNLKSTPYIDMTLEIIRRFGVEISHSEHKIFDIPGNQSYDGTDLDIEPDWSGLAFVLVAAAITEAQNISGKEDTSSLDQITSVHNIPDKEGSGLTQTPDLYKGSGKDDGHNSVQITGVQKESFQADRAIIEVLEMVGCEVIFENDSISVEADNLLSFNFDATHCPDLFPPLCVLATQCVGVSKISGIHRLKHKESNRGETLQNELGKLGARIEIKGDDMIIVGKQELHGAKADACGDHRIAMALVCAGLIADGQTVINGAECVAKSYREFYSDIRTLSGRVEGDSDIKATSSTS